MAAGEVTTAEWGGYLCRSLHITTIFEKKKKKKKRALWIWTEAKEGFISSNTEKHIKGSEPQRSIVAAGSALVWCPLCLDCTEAK